MGNSSALPPRFKKRDEDERSPLRLEDGGVTDEEAEEIRSEYPDQSAPPPPPAGRLSETYVEMKGMVNEREGYPYRPILKCTNDNSSLLMFCKMLRNVQSDDIVFNCDLRSLFPRLTFEIKYVPSDSTNPSYEYTYGDPTGTWTNEDMLQLAREYDPGEDVFVRMEGVPEEEDELEYREETPEDSTLSRREGAGTAETERANDAHPDLRNRRAYETAPSETREERRDRSSRSFAVGLQTSSLHAMFLACRALDGSWKHVLDERAKYLVDVLLKVRLKGTTSASLSCDEDPDQDNATGEDPEDLPRGESLRKIEDELECLNNLRKCYGEGVEGALRYYADQKRGLDACLLFMTAAEDRERRRDPSPEGEDFLRIIENLRTVLETLKTQEQEMCRWHR